MPLPKVCLKCASSVHNSNLWNTGAHHLIPDVRSHVRAQGYLTGFIMLIFTAEILANFAAKRDYGAYPTCGSRFTSACAALDLCAPQPFYR